MQGVSELLKEEWLQSLWKRTISGPWLLFPVHSSTKRRKWVLNFYEQKQNNKTGHDTPWQVYRSSHREGCKTASYLNRLAIKKGLAWKGCYKKCSFCFSFFLFVCLFFFQEVLLSGNSHLSSLFIQKLVSCRYLQLWSPHKALPDVLFSRRTYYFMRNPGLKHYLAMLGSHTSNDDSLRPYKVSCASIQSSLCFWFWRKLIILKDGEPQIKPSYYWFMERCFHSFSILANTFVKCRESVT